ncbi:MAG: glycosyltransferase family 4 protein [Actinomycetota bacterium]|nr:glycosyltransferase family 4 protein [Actinomycetota bacterium]
MTWATIATRNPMGQQHYETEVQKAITALADSRFDFHGLRVTSLRSDIDGARRTPVGLNERAPFLVALAVGAATYRTTALVHRFDLRLPPHPGPEVITAHDLPPARFDDEGGLPRSIAAGARRARVVIAPSEFAAAELRDLLDVSRIKVIPYGLSAPYDDPRPAERRVLTGLGIDGPFLVHAAGASARKNLDGLAAAWKIISAREPDLRLVLCGPPDARRDDTFAGLSNVIKTGRLQPDVVAGVMSHAEVVIVPSTYEGFGLPALEGMACGRPVVAAARGALPEVCADAALLVEPDGKSLAAGIATILTDDEERNRLMTAGPRRAASFSWDVAARRHLEVYAEALGM